MIIHTLRMIVLVINGFQIRLTFHSMRMWGFHERSVHYIDLLRLRCQQSPAEGIHRYPCEILQGFVLLSQSPRKILAGLVNYVRLKNVPLNRKYIFVICLTKPKGRADTNFQTCVQGSFTITTDFATVKGSRWVDK